MTHAEQITFCQSSISSLSQLIRSTSDRQLVKDLTTLATHYRQTLQSISQKSF